MAEKGQMLGQLEIGRGNASYWLVSSLCENHDKSLSYKESHFFDPSPVFLFFVQFKNLVAHLVGDMLGARVGSRKSPEAN